MSRFLPLRVERTEKIIRDAVALTLVPEDPSAFAFEPGQYLTFAREFDGVELRRNYSICAARGEALRVGIKRVDGGTFSTWANTELSPGDTLHAMPPSGRFTMPPGTAAPRVLAVAGGSGITPILGILRTVLRDDGDARAALVYANRAVSTIMFREEIEDLKNRFMGRLTVLHLLEAEGQADLLTGRLTREKAGEIFARWLAPESVDIAFICGPGPMMDAAAAALGDIGVPRDAIRIERFTAGQRGLAPRAASAADASVSATMATITLDGATHEVPVPPGASILEAARAAGLEAPFACRAGVCSTCMARLISGRVEMLQNHALEDYEVAQGRILTCQSRCLTEEVKVVYEDH